MSYSVKVALGGKWKGGAYYSNTKMYKWTDMLYTSIVQMNCFRAGRINKNVLNALEIQSGIQCKVSSFTGYVGITKKDIDITANLKILVSGYKLLG